MHQSRVDHGRRQVVEYSESELRLGGQGRGWADVASLGVEPAELAKLAATGRQRALGGFVFRERRAPATDDGRVRELWWSEDAALPLRIATREAHVTRAVEVRSLRLGVDAAVVEDPRRRFPDYTVIDAVDVREQHHEGAAGEHGGS
jgi:hypothetical protein